MIEPAPAAKTLYRKDPLYDTGVTKVTAFATILIVISITLTGIIAYYITKEQSVKKLKESDLVYIAGSIASKIDGSIERALETSLMLSIDPEIKNWIAGGEKPGVQADRIMEKLAALKDSFSYSNSFIVSVPSRQYWSENGKVIDVVSKDDPDDDWFFKMLDEKRRYEIMIDYNEDRQDTSVFVNAFMYSGGEPLALVGVGLSLKDMSERFASYKYGANGSLWLTDRTGNIYLSDEFEQNGRNLRDFMPQEAAERVIASMDQDQAVLDYKGTNGRINDLVLFPIPSTDWNLLVSVDRNEAISFLKTIQVQTVIAVAIALLSIVFFFYYTSRKLADPYKRAVKLNLELERQIAERTKELAEQNEKMTDSLDYAKRIQVSVLPSEEEMNRVLPDHFVLWRPKDRVGGDFYWMRQVNEGVLIAVGDCTGHGVPGALMSIMTISLLDQITEQGQGLDPAAILSKLNRSIKATLNQGGSDGLTDDGLDIAILLISEEKASFAGAGRSLFIRTSEGLLEIGGNRKAVGYRKTPLDYSFTCTSFTFAADDTFYLSTDGITDQNGGDKNISFGKTRLKQWLTRYGDKDIPLQKKLLEDELISYMGDEPQRDDITVIGFRPWSAMSVIKMIPGTDTPSP